MLCLPDRTEIFVTVARRTLVAAIALPLAACASGTMEDAAPQGALPPPGNPSTVSAPSADAVPVPTASSAMPVAPRNTGTYPNLNIPPRTAAPQMSDEEASSTKQELIQTRAGHKVAGGNGSPGADDLRKLREIGRRQSADTVGQAEAE